MILYGLTGGVGMGKSTAAALLEGWGVPVVDTDVIARELTAPGCEALGEIEAAFGPEVMAPDGRLDRGRLADVVFGQESRRGELERILHPRIRREWLERVERLREAGREAAVVVIPLLFETGAEALGLKTACVACTERSQRERLRGRGWTDEQVLMRVQSQWPIGWKMDRADFVIWSEGPMAALEKQLRRIFGGRPEAGEAAGEAAEWKKNLDKGWHAVQTRPPYRTQFESP